MDHLLRAERTQKGFFFLIIASLLVTVLAEYFPITTSIILAIGVAIQLVILYSPEDAYRRNSRVKGKLNGLYKFKGESDEDFIYMHTYLKHFIIPKSTDKE